MKDERRHQMKEKKTTQESEKVLVIDINLTGGLALVLLAALLLAVTLGYGLLGQPAAAAASPQAPASSAGMRQYYLSLGGYNGDEADGNDGNGGGVCAEGYHFASLWEILDPSNLKYNSTLVFTLADSGQGPPAAALGWVRTGYNASTSAVFGTGNCDNWSTNSQTANGPLALLDRTWDSVEAFPGWTFSVTAFGCQDRYPVWCVED
jgi:hypothetical protein